MSIRSVRPILLKRGRNRKPRSKTFSTEVSAKKWAEEQKLKDFKVVPAKKGKRFMIK